MVGWCFDLDGRRERDERAKPTVGRAGNLSDGIVAVFSLVRFQETEMRKIIKEIIRLLIAICLLKGEDGLSIQTCALSITHDSGR